MPVYTFPVTLGHETAFAATLTTPLVDATMRTRAASPLSGCTGCVASGSKAGASHDRYPAAGG